MKHSQLFFSIIIPTFNSAKTLSICLDSILKQSFQNFEILILDGCSTDDTIITIKNYASLAVSQIVWVSEKDNGIYDAMNKGIVLAKGEWIYFLGSDDKLMADNVLFQINEAIKNSNSLDIIYGDVFDIHTNCITGGEFSKEMLTTKNICHQAIFLKKEVFQKIGNYNLQYNVCADWDHNIRWFESENITNSYVNIVCAVYAEGGYSSKYNDSFYGNMRWKNFLIDRSKFTLGYKFLILKFEISKSMREFDFKKLTYLLFHFPSFFLNNSSMRKATY